jgi:folate-dependent phosphoribosylglycinamide formyltransferase PurN
MREPDRRSVVLLGDRGPSTRAVYHALAAGLGDGVELHALLESSPSRLTLARRRARRLGWGTVTGHVLFMGAVMPLLRRQGRRRMAEIATQYELDFRPISRGAYVESVNDPRTLALLADAEPDLVVVHGTRIIAERVLREIPAPVVNVHAGITPRYRGVHGGYWAFADGRPDLAGTTVHLVDAGIDTGGILGQSTFDRAHDDTIATYPYLHLACGLPILVKVASALLSGAPVVPRPPLAGAEVSHLRWHPTAWGYVANRVRLGVA